VIGSTFGQYRLDPRFGILDILLDERDAKHLDLTTRAATGRHRHTSVQHDVKFLIDVSGLVGILLVFKPYTQSLIELFTHWSSLLCAWLSISMHTQDVLGDLAVAKVVDIICNNEEQIKTR
jgi:hypothetical protein